MENTEKKVWFLDNFDHVDFWGKMDKAETKEEEQKLLNELALHLVVNKD